tara:strand:+ start:973 stop:1608 length:636 start_codon:yes stop_codon:yes gene_type:complete
MAKKIGATFDPNSIWKPIEEGTYPAHIKSISNREIQTRAGEAIVVNMTYKVSDDVDKETQLLWKMDGYEYVKDDNGNRIPIENGNGTQSTSSCDHLKGRDFQDNGWFIFTSGSAAGKNKRYFELLANLEVKCKEEKVDGKTMKTLVLLEESDVVGKPVKITVKRQEFVTSETKHLPPDQQVKRSTFKVSNVTEWTEGQQLQVDELEGDVPF